MKILSSKLRVLYKKISFGLYILGFNLKLFLKIKQLPYKITLKLNNNCNLKCNFCNIWKNSEKSILEFKKLKKIIQNYGKNIRIFSFTGGEIFLLHDIQQKIEYTLHHCKKLHIFSMTTNGFLTDKIYHIIENILIKFPNKIIIINISIDGNEITHNQLRGSKLSYLNAIKTYNKLLKIEKKFPNLKVNQEFLASDKNISFLEEKCKQKNTIISFVQNSDYYGISDINVQKIKISEKLLKQTKGFLKKKFLHGYIKKHYDCFAILSSLFIDWNGDIKPCIKWNVSLGNIGKHDINSILKIKKNNLYIKQIKQKKCPGCWTPCEGYLSIIHQPWK